MSVTIYVAKGGKLKPVTESEFTANKCAAREHFRGTQCGICDNCLAPYGRRGQMVVCAEVPSAPSIPQEMPRSLEDPWCYNFAPLK